MTDEPGDKPSPQASSVEREIPPSGLMTGKAACEWLGITFKVFRKLVKNGEMPFVVFGRRKFYTVDDLKKLIEQRKRVMVPLEPTPRRGLKFTDLA